MRRPAPTPPGPPVRQTTGMETQLTRLRDGEITFTQFVLATRPQWERLAGRVLSRWKIPPSADVEDLVQEMLMAIPALLEQWDPGRGVKLNRYVVWSAMNRAKIYVHKQRCAPLRNGDRNASRFALPQAMLGDLTWQRAIDGSAAAPQQQRVDVLLDAMHAAQSESDRAVLEGLLAGWGGPESLRIIMGDERIDVTTPGKAAALMRDTALRVYQDINRAEVV